ncbi:MAG: hypothetical protein WC389_03545 [Lutibacter sp.]|jgi:hypothetical protein
MNSRLEILNDIIDKNIEKTNGFYGYIVKTFKHEIKALIKDIISEYAGKLKEIDK